MPPRKQPMKAGAGLKRAAPARAAASRKPQRDTGPSRAVRNLVMEREGRACAACGVSVTGQPFSIQHRRPRGMGGTSDPAANSLSNLVLMCGTGVTGCHGLAESRDPEMNARGFWLTFGEPPAETPVMLASEHGSGVLVWLDDDGGYSAAPPAGSVAA